MIGYLWSILYPIIYFTVLYVVFVLFLKMGAGTPHWPVAMLLGIVIWTFFDEATHRSLGTVVAHGGLLRKIDFDKPILVISELAGAAINFGINLCVILVFALINGVHINWTIIFVIPLIFELLLVTAGISFIVATIYVSFRDIEPIWNVLLQVGMFGSIIIYPFSYIYNTHQLITRILLLNPLAQIIGDIRWALLGNLTGDYPPVFQVIFNPLVLAIPYILSVAIFAFGYWIYNRQAADFAEVI